MPNDSISLDALRDRIEAAEAEFRHAEEAVRKAEEQRERLRTALQVFQEMLAGVEQGTPEVPAAEPSAPVEPAGSSKPKPRRKPEKASAPPFTAPDLAILELEQRGDFLPTKELLEALQRDGYKPKGKGKPYDSLYGSLWHAAKKDGSRLINKDALWGLREWLEPGWAPRRKEVAS